MIITKKHLSRRTFLRGTFGATMALMRKMQEGGSWLVRVSLAQTAHWLMQLGRVPGGFDCPEPADAEIESLRDGMDTPVGRLAFVRHAAKLTETPARWSRAPVPLGTHAPVWPV